VSDDESTPPDDAGTTEDADGLFDDESIGDADEIDDPFARLDENASGRDASEGDASGEAVPESDTGAESETFDESETSDETRGETETGWKAETGEEAETEREAKTEGEPRGHGPVDAGRDDDASEFGSAADTDRARSDDPFDELGPATGETDADLGDAFEQMDVGSVAEEDVWESLDEGTAGGVGELGVGVSETDATGTDLGGGFGAGVERVISKRTYCQQCPHFSAPPTVSCDHEGTTILEAVGFDEFRVRDCPMINEDDPTFDAEPER